MFAWTSCTSSFYQDVGDKGKQFTSFQMIISSLYACVRNACLNELRHSGHKE